MANPSTPAAAPSQKMTPQQINSLQRQAVLSQSVEMTQTIFNQTIFPPSNPVLNVVPRNVGLIKRFVVEVTGTLNNTSGTVAQLTDFGLANLLQTVQFTDLNNNVRINTQGNHLSLL